MANEWDVVAEQPLSEWAVVSQTPAVDGGKFSRDLAAKGLPALSRPKVSALAPRQEPTPQDILANSMQAAFAIEQQRQADESQAVEDYETGSLAEAAQGIDRARKGETLDERAGGAAQAIRGGLKAAAPAMLTIGPSAAITGGVPMLKGLAVDAAAGYAAGKAGRATAKALGAGEGVQELTEEALGVAVTGPRAVKRIIGAEPPRAGATPQQRFAEAQRKAQGVADAQRVEATDWAVVSRELIRPDVLEAAPPAEIAVPAAKAARKPRQRKPKAETQTPESQIAANEARMAEIQKQLEAQQPPATPTGNQIEQGSPQVSVVDTVRSSEPGPEIPVSMVQLRSESPLKGADFDKAIIAAADLGEVKLTTHDHGGALTPEQRTELGLVQDPQDPKKWYTAATRMEQPRGMSGRPVSEARKTTQTGAAVIPAKEISEGLTKAKTAMVDRFAPIEDLEKIAADEISAEMSPYKAARSFGGHQGIVANRLNQLRQIFRPAKKDGYLEDAVELGMLERHEELGARLPGYVNPDGMTQQQVSAARQALEQQIAQGGKGQDAAKLLSDWRAYNDNLMQELKDGGIISQESLDAIRKGNEKYIPFNRVEYLQKELDSDTIPQGSNAFSVASQNIVHRIEGSDKEIADPILSTVRNTMRVTKLVERNNVVRRVAALATRPEFAATVIPMKPNQKMIPAGFEPVSYLQDGIKQQVLVPTGVAESLKQLNEQQADFLTKAVTTFGSMLRAGVTLDPVFMARNVARDFQTASVNNRLQGVIGFTPADWVRGFAGALGRGISDPRSPLNDKLYREFLESKGAFGGFYHRGNLKETTTGLTESAGAKIAKTVLNPLELMRTVGETFELAPRLGVFSKARKQGLSPTESGWKARNATVDFERRGTAMRVINMAVPFLNARMQGTLNLYGAIREAPLTTMSRLTMVAGAPFLAMYAWNNKNFPKLYDEVSDREKENNYVFIYGDKRDDEGNLTQAVKIPKGEVSPYVNALENFLEWYRGKDAKGWQQVVTQFGSDSSPVPFAREGKLSFRETRSATLPPVLKVAEELGTNKNVYTGRDIVPPYLQKASPQEQYTSRTPAYMVKASEGLGKIGVDVSPMMLQNVLGTQFGYLGRRAADVKNIPQSMAKSFKGAYATSKDSQRMERLTDIQRKEADRDVIVSREARRMYDRVSNNRTREEFAAAFSEADAAVGAKLDTGGKLKPDQRQKLRKKLLQEFADVIEMRAKDMSPFERQLSNASAETRAEMVIQELKTLQGDERRKLFQDWQQKKLITPRVMDKMAELLANQ